jgi:hypothetical protein
LESSSRVQIFCSRACVCAMVPPVGTNVTKKANAAPKLFLMVAPL